MRLINLKCNGEQSPNQVEREKLYFSWNLESESCGACQTAYEIRLKEEEECIWDSGKTESGECLYIPYTGPSLKNSTRYRWQVKAWDEEGKETDYAEASFETGIEKWEAKWIGYDKPDEGKAYNPKKPFYCADDYAEGKNELFLPPAPYLRKEFEIPEKVKRAKLYVSAFGLIDVEINGKKVTENRLVPGISNYEETVYGFAFDVGKLLVTGINTLSVVLADGWYAGYMGLNNREWFGSKPRVMMQLEIEEEGKKQTIVTDALWKAAYGGLREADIFEGEKFDAIREPEGWRESGFDDSGWDSVDTGAEYEIVPVPHPGVPIVIHDCVPAADISAVSPGLYRVRFDKYICGVLYVRVKGLKGSGIVIRHAEILDETGELYLAGNRSARAQDEYILKGGGEEIFCPQFTYHGFRYASIGITGQAEILEVKGIRIGSKLSELTTFASDNETVNTVFEMVRATEKANLMDVPTDCCARDERLGWGAEGNHFMYAMAYLNNQYLMLRKWAKDIWDAQRENGALEAIAPTMRMKDVEPFVGDIQSYHGIHMVYALYRIYGDLPTVRTYYPKMEKFFVFLENNSDRYLRYATSCDWLGILEATGHSDTNHGYGESSPVVVGTAHYALAALKMYEMSVAIGNKEGAAKYKSLYDNIIRSFRRHLVERDGTLRYKTQGDYLIALACGGFSGEEKEKAVRYLEEKMTKDGFIRWFGGTITTPYLLDTLKENGKGYLANRFLASVRYPSIGYMHEKGFDTIWERWDGLWENGKLHPQPMNAFCHIGFSVIGSYLISGVAGIDTVTAGFREILICPGVSKEITQCSAVYQSVYGEVEAVWKWQEGVFDIRIKIPPCTRAKAILPCTVEDSLEILAGGAREKQYKEGKVFFEIVSGRHRFRTATEII